MNSRHHQRTTSGMTSSSSATSSNSNNINNERHRDNNSRSGELQKVSGTAAAYNEESREDDSPKDGHLNRLHHQNGKILHITFKCEHTPLSVTRHDEGLVRTQCASVQSTLFFITLPSERTTKMDLRLYFRMKTSSHAYFDL